MKNHNFLRIITIIIAIIFSLLVWVSTRDLFRVLLAILVTALLIIKYNNNEK